METLSGSIIKNEVPYQARVNEEDLSVVKEDLVRELATDELLRQILKERSNESRKIAETS